MGRHGSAEIPLEFRVTSVVIRIRRRVSPGGGGNSADDCSDPATHTHTQTTCMATLPGLRRHGIKREKLGNGFRYMREEKIGPLFHRSMGAHRHNWDVLVKHLEWRRIIQASFRPHTKRDRIIGLLYGNFIFAGYLFDIGRESVFSMGRFSFPQALWSPFHHSCQGVWRQYGIRMAWIGNGEGGLFPLPGSFPGGYG